MVTRDLSANSKASEFLIMYRYLDLRNWQNLWTYFPKQRIMVRKIEDSIDLRGKMQLSEVIKAPSIPCHLPIARVRNIASRNSIEDNLLNHYNKSFFSQTNERLEFSKQRSVEIRQKCCRRSSRHWELHLRLWFEWRLFYLIRSRLSLI